MARQGDYGWWTQRYEDVSGTAAVSATGTLKTVRKAGYAIFLQRAHFQVTGAAAGSWELRDSGGTQLTGPVDTATDGAHYDMDFGPAGVQLTENTNLNITVTGTATGIVAWEAYQKQVLTLAASAT